MDLPDTTGLSWREGVYWCLRCDWARTRSPPPAALHSSMLLFAAQSSPPLEFPAPIRTPVSAPRPPVPAPHQRPPVSAPRECPQVPAPRERAPSSALSSRVPIRARSPVPLSCTGLQGTHAPPSGENCHMCVPVEFPVFPCLDSVYVLYKHQLIGGEETEWWSQSGCVCKLGSTEGMRRCVSGP